MILNLKELPNLIPENANIHINTTKVNEITHGFHKYPGKFIPQIPNWAIKTYLPEDNCVVLDPFSGSGTTLVEAMILNHQAIGIDIDPLSNLIAKVKTTPVDIENFITVKQWILSNMKDIDKVFLPITHNLEHWFTEDAITKLGKIRTIIDELENEFKHIEDINDIKDVMLIAFSAIIRRVSNADNQSQKTYVSGTKPKIPVEVYRTFERQLNNFEKGLIELVENIGSNSGSKLILSDGSPDFSRLLESEVDLIVSSPPYIKSIDYVYNQMVELFWIGDLFGMDTQKKQNKKRRKYTGTTLVKKSEYERVIEEFPFFNLGLLDDTLEKIIETDKKNGLKHVYIVAEYFQFMSSHFESAYKCLKQGSHYVMVIGNSKISQIEVNTAEILIQLAKRKGFTISTRWSYLIKNHFMGFDRKKRGGKIKTDHVLVFVKE